MPPRPLVLAVLIIALPLLPAEAAPRDCQVPPELIDSEDLQLPLMAQRLREKEPVTIVAIGGASTAGTAAANPEQEAYPRRLEENLRRRHPDVQITVINKGVARQTTQDMVNRFPTDIYPLAPTLVVWETGTADAVRSLDVDAFATALEAGIADLKEHRLDIMLVNMQYSRGTASVINFEPYLEAMQHTADVDDVYLFRRFETMKYWSENGVFNFIDVPKEQRAPLAAQVYECLAERIADAIERAVR
jgi:lysophospholipase L1-like esterase